MEGGRTLEVEEVRTPQRTDAENTNLEVCNYRDRSS